jgi:hypothetical protein
MCRGLPPVPEIQETPESAKDDVCGGTSGTQQISETAKDDFGDGTSGTRLGGCAGGTGGSLGGRRLSRASLAAMATKRMALSRLEWSHEWLTFDEEGAPQRGVAELAVCMLLIELVLGGFLSLGFVATSPPAGIVGSTPFDNMLCRLGQYLASALLLLRTPWQCMPF